MADKKYLTEIAFLTKTYNIQDLDDWLFWHLNILKFDHIHIFDNESLVNIQPVCERYGDKIDMEYIIGWPDQYNLYADYIKHSNSIWTLFIDDDEFLYIGPKYGNNIVSYVLQMMTLYPDVRKLGFGWLNLFPEEYTVRRTCGLIENATAYYQHVDWDWQIDSTIKTMVKTGGKSYSWMSEFPMRAHNPVIDNKVVPAYMYDGRKIMTSWTSFTEPESDALLVHYQYKSAEEWSEKCNTRIGSGSKVLYKNYSDNYDKLYNYSNQFETFDALVKLWRNYK